FPIAKLAALLAIGYTLDELPNDITQQTTAAFEPALDYVAVKAPRFDFAKFPGSSDTLGSEMRAVGESLGLGRTFPEAFLTAMQGREWTPPTLDLERRGEPLPERWDLLLEAARQELDLPGIHAYFAQELRDIAAAERDCTDILAAKRFGLPDETIARALGLDEADVRAQRPPPGRLAVDSCAAEFEAETPYFYLSYEPSDDEPQPTGRAIVVLGSGPNRIGQGIEFDYCCVHAARTFRALGYESVLVNPNPETVSTDYDTSDRLYLEPLTVERTLDVCALEQPLGVVVSFGGQTPLRLAPALVDAGVPLLGNPLGAIDAAEDRVRFAQLLDGLGLNAPPWRAAAGAEEALAAAEELGYPVLVRPHHVIGGRGIHVARNAAELDVHGPCLVDRFLANAVELDVDVLCDGDDAWVAAILEHVERAGSHSGDSAVVVPAPSVPAPRQAEIREAATAIARALGARGLLNLQLAIEGDALYVLEANPRASRTVPFVAKATGIPLVEHACRLLLGEPLRALDLPEQSTPSRAWAKEAIFPSDRFVTAATRGPEMRSTGEVMASGATPAAAYARALRAAGASSRGGRIGPPLQATRL
ncbi:MAG: carbamoyl-phosphate synthase large subunit, partial [Gaiellaceae bacterium]|nr:carbamoyl-phosphate synthase large subunit [Gaiellaceae bacterium]